VAESNLTLGINNPLLPASRSRTADALPARPVVLIATLCALRLQFGLPPNGMALKKQRIRKRDNAKIFRDIQLFHFVQDLQPVNGKPGRKSVVIFFDDETEPDIPVDCSGKIITPVFKKHFKRIN
jgi:hypothetical protein